MDRNVKLLGGILLFVFVFSWAYSGVNSTNMDLVFINGGMFRMGNIFSDGDSSERPVHEVSINSFYLCKYEVTISEFREFVEATGYKTTAEISGGTEIFDGERMIRDSQVCWKHVNFNQTDRHPVVCVSWYDAVKYCNWRSEKENLQPCYSGEGGNVVCNFTANGYRLPTEAEWEFASRSQGRDYKYSWGNGEPYINDIKAANICDETAKRRLGEAVTAYWEGYNDGYLFTSPVGTFAPNELGLYDMSGNVQEWCWDWYDENYYLDSSGNNPRGALIGTLRCCRDVGYDCPVKFTRVAYRGKAKPENRSLHGGFRLARSIDKDKSS